MLTELLQSKLGILSLSQSITAPLLWAHYAESHKGFAIKFDARHWFFNRRRSSSDELFHLRQVRYVDEARPQLTMMELNGDELLVTKGSSWAYESEWRMLMPVDHAEEVLTVAGEKIFLFSLPASAISGVVIGMRAREVTICQIKQILRSKNLRHVTLQRAVLAGESHRLEFEKIE